MAAPSNPLNALEYSTEDEEVWTADASYVVGSEANRLMFVANQIEESGRTILGVTYDDVAFTLVDEIVEGINYGSLWALVAPANTTAAVVLTMSHTTDSGSTAIIWYHSDAEQIIPVEGKDTASLADSDQTAFDLDCITSGVDRTIIAAFGHGDSDVIASGETLIHEIGFTSMRGSASYHQQASAGTRNMDFTFIAARRTNMVVVAVRPVGAAAASIADYRFRQRMR